MRRSLLIVLAAALLLRAANLDFGLDWGDPSRAIFSHQQDEEGMVRAVLDGALQGDLDPGVFRLWGSAGYYVFAAADALVLLPAALAHPERWSGVVEDLRRNPSTLHLVHRAVSVLASLATLWVVVRLARRELGARAGLVAALLLAGCYLPAREAHFGVLDTLCALWVVLAVDRSLALAARPGAREHLLAGLCVGLAAATKYFGGVAALCVVAAHFSARPRRFGLLVLAGAASIAAFLAASPHVLYAWEEWLAALRFQRDTIGGQTDAATVAALVAHHLRYGFLVGMGETLFVLALAGAVLALRAGGRLRLLVLCVLLLMPMFLVARSRAVRYGIAHVSLLVPLAALAVDAMAGARRGRLAALVALALLPSLARLVSFDLALGGRDTRHEALDFLERSGAARDDVVAVGLYLPRPSMIGTGRPGEAAASWPFIDYLKATRPGAWLTREEGRAWRPRFLLRDEGSTGWDPLGWQDFARAAETEYRVAARFDARAAPGEAVLPDPVAGTPAFFLPYTNPWAMSRPGPPLVIYERVEP